jgi:hypothetical protein
MGSLEASDCVQSALMSHRWDREDMMSWTALEVCSSALPTNDLWLVIQTVR